MEKLSFYGVGPRIARFLLPWLAVCLTLTLFFRDLFTISHAEASSLKITGTILLTGGFVLYFATLPLLLRGLKETRLVTSGAFSICRNPLYSSIILFILPGAALLLNSWLMLTVPLVGYIVFKMYIKHEYDEMEKFFGDEYRIYSEATPELFPMQVHKWFRK